MLDLSLFKENKGVKLLITTDGWFYAKDGRQYRSVWGTCTVHKSKEILGFINSHGTNWLVQVGCNNSSLFIMGCQIHYVQICSQKPKGPDVLILE